MALIAAVGMFAVYLFVLFGSQPATHFGESSSNNKIATEMQLSFTEDESLKNHNEDIQIEDIQENM